LLYLGAVLVIAVVAGRGPAIAASIAAFLTFDFFFTQPRFTFTVRDPSEWVALLTFLLVATVTGQLAATQRGRVEDAEAREREASLLHDISGLLGARPYKEALDAVAGRLRSELGLEAVAIELVDIGSTIPRVAAGDAAAVRTAREASGSMTVLGASEAADPRHPSEPGRWLRVTPPHRPGRRSVARGMIRIPIRGQGPALIGDLILLAGRERGPLGPRDARLLATAAAQLALAVEQQRLRREATEAEVLRRADRLKSALLDSVSHDLRTPLATVRAAAGSLADASLHLSDAERVRLGEAIDAEAERLNRLVTNLLDMSGVDSGTLRPDTELLPVASVVEPVVERFASELREYRLEVDLPDSLPAICGDPLMLDQILTNLVENATKYASPGARIRISASALPSTASLHLVVEDSGGGVPEHALSKLFDKFYRVSRTGAGARRGTGLGLAVVRGLVHAVNGEVSASRSPLGGLAIVLELPTEGPTGEADADTIANAEPTRRP
jgi:two-component system sensor histidine kinase KdpD